MKTTLLLVISFFAVFTAIAQPCITVSSECDGSTNYCGPYELSNGIYRIPFANGTEVTITNDHFNHCPRGRIDMVGNNGSSIVAAADGWIRFIEDDNTQQCDCGETFCLNNYIWMEHANGEWTKYTHMQTNSVPGTLDIGDWVTAGTFLGTEGEVGCASGVHLHFEVAQPVDTNTLVISLDGGYFDGNWAKNVIPVICDIAGNVFEEDEDYVAANCGNGCATSITNNFNILGVGGYDADIASGNITASSLVTIGDYASVLYQAGDYIALAIGFEALTNSTVTARIGGCNDFPDKLSNEMNTETLFEAMDEEGSFYLFPNPASEAVTVRFEKLMNAECIFMITNVLGKVLYELVLENSQREITIPVANFAGGIYQCSFFAGHQVIETKLLSIVK